MQIKQNKKNVGTFNLRSSAEKEEELVEELIKQSIENFGIITQNRKGSELKIYTRKY